MRRNSLKNFVLASLLVAIGLVLPFLTGQIPLIGKQLLPMHLPVLLGGFFVGTPLATAIGFILPLFRSFLFGTPPLFPTAVAMAFELATYGYLVSRFNRLFPYKTIYIYFNLILSMIGGRLVWGMVSFILYGVSGTNFTWEVFIASAFWTPLIGIIIQLVIIPALVVTIRESRRGR